MVRLAGVRKAFHRGTPDERAALDGIDLKVAPGSFVVVIGSNGAGKSSLLNAVGGVITTEAGSIHIGGSDVSGWPEHRRARLVARVLQDPLQGTLPALTIEENLALAELRAAGRGLGRALTAARRAHYAGLLGAYGLGLETRLGARAGQLSGGQRQVLTLAMAVMNTPSVLLLDEHAAALDPRTAERVMQATLRAVTDARLSTLMVTHNMQHAIRYGDRLLMMDAGRIRLDVSGEAKARLSVETLVERFRIADDRMLLA
jgi:putative tryptophan/tyrosine transport system ATP-binding protein